MATTSDSETINYGTRIPQEEAEYIEAFRDNRGLNKSEAIRKLVSRGLEGPLERATRITSTASIFFAVVFTIWAGIVLLFGGVGVADSGVSASVSALLSTGALAAACTSVIASAMLYTGIARWIDNTGF